MVRNGDIYNYVAFLSTDEWAEEGWSIPSKVETILDVFSDYNQQVKNIIAATPKDQCYKWGIFTRKPTHKWSTDKVTLLGDAAHPVEPFMGQGASTAIEDAVVIGRVIEDSSTPNEIIKRYFYREGMYSYLLSTNAEIFKAQEIITDIQTYQTILK